jgi:hypothetical protein
VAIEVIIQFHWAHDIRIYDRARAAVPFLVTVAVGPREEYNFVVFCNDNKCNLGLEIQSFTGVCGLAVMRRRERSLRPRTRGKGGKDGTDFG